MNINSIVQFSLLALVLLSPLLWSCWMMLFRPEDFLWRIRNAVFEAPESDKIRVVDAIMFGIMVFICTLCTILGLLLIDSLTEKVLSVDARGNLLVIMPMMLFVASMLRATVWFARKQHRENKKRYEN